MKVGLQRSELTRSVFENNIPLLTRGTVIADIWIAVSLCTFFINWRSEYPKLREH